MERGKFFAWIKSVNQLSEMNNSDLKVIWYRLMRHGKGCLPDYRENSQEPVWQYRLGQGALALVSAWFVWQMLFFTLVIVRNTSPDEGEHLLTAVTQFESGQFLYAPNEKDVEWGPLDKKVYLYPWLVGTWLHLNFFDTDRLIFARYLNIGLSLMTFVFSLGIYRLLFRSIWTVVLAAIFQSGFLMYTFMAPMISYDTLTNLLSAAALYFFLHYLKDNRLSALASCLLCLLFGSLTKLTVLPLAAFLGLWSLAVLIKHGPAQDQIWPSSWGQRLQFICLFGLVLFAGTLNFRLHGLNLMNYGSLDPSCSDVWGETACKKVAGHAVYKELEEINAKEPRMAADEFTRKYFRLAHEKLIGIFGHRHFPWHSKYYKDRFNWIYSLSFGLLLLTLRWHWRRMFLPVLCTAAFYMAVVLIQNYTGYLRYGHFGAGLQARYWFPVFPLMVAVLAWGWDDPMPFWPRIVGILGIAAVLFQGGYWYFINNIDQGWLIKSSWMYRLVFL